MTATSVAQGSMLGRREAAGGSILACRAALLDLAKDFDRRVAAACLTGEINRGIQIQEVAHA